MSYDEKDTKRRFNFDDFCDTVITGSICHPFFVLYHPCTLCSNIARIDWRFEIAPDIVTREWDGSWDNAKSEKERKNKKKFQCLSMGFIRALTFYTVMTLGSYRQVVIVDIKFNIVIYWDSKNSFLLLFEYFT